MRIGRLMERFCGLDEASYRPGLGDTGQPALIVPGGEI